VYAPPKDKSVDTDFYLNLHGVENKWGFWCDKLSKPLHFSILFFVTTIG
jgi:hypothetical protein